MEENECRRAHDAAIEAYEKLFKLHSNDVVNTLLLVVFDGTCVIYS